MSQITGDYLPVTSFGESCLPCPSPPAAPLTAGLPSGPGVLSSPGRVPPGPVASVPGDCSPASFLGDSCLPYPSLTQAAAPPAAGPRPRSGSEARPGLAARDRLGWFRRGPVSALGEAAGSTSTRLVRAGVLGLQSGGFPW
jgi:hypothetical protein